MKVLRIIAAVIITPLVIFWGIALVSYIRNPRIITLEPGFFIIDLGGFIALAYLLWRIVKKLSQ